MGMVSEVLPGGSRNPEENFWEREHRRQLNAVMDDHGFFFHTLDEARKIREFMPRPNRTRPVLGFFNMIGRTSEDPAKETSMALSTLVDYAGKSLDNVDYVHSVEEALFETPDQDALFLDAFPILDWHLDTNKRAEFAVIARFVETSNFARDGETDGLIKKERLDLKSSEEAVARIALALRDFSVDMLKSVCAVTIESEVARATYWKARIEDATDYMQVRDQAQEAIGILNARMIKIS